jgi:hypothetical protein
MSPESALRKAIAESMIGISAGEIVLRDEGAKTNWKVEVGAFRLAPYPVTQGSGKVAFQQASSRLTGRSGLRA